MSSSTAQATANFKAKEKSLFQQMLVQKFLPFNILLFRISMTTNNSSNH
jgi:hypothetical protein